MTGHDPWADLGERHPDVLLAVRDIWPARAVWLPDSRVIFIDKRLNHAEGRCALTHEVAHIDLGHAHSGFPWFDARQEFEADREAGRRLVSARSIAEALTVSQDASTVADALNIDQHLLGVRLRTLHPSERHLILARLAQVEQVA